MKFSEMPYQRPDLDAVKQQFADLCARFKAAESYAEARAVFLVEEKLNKHVDTQAQLASVRNSDRHPRHLLRRGDEFLERGRPPAAGVPERMEPAPCSIRRSARILPLSTAT